MHASTRFFGNYFLPFVVWKLLEFKLFSGLNVHLKKEFLLSGWMTLNLGRMGDFMPHTNKVYLPVTETKKKLYQRMSKEIFHGREKKAKVGYKYFLQMWNKKFPEYIVGKVFYSWILSILGYKTSGSLPLDHCLKQIVSKNTLLCNMPSLSHEEWFWESNPSHQK
jgi:hypothetical protein